MLRTLAIAVVVLLISSGSAQPSLAQGHSLTVEVAGVRGDEGAVIVCLWEEANAGSFPRCPSDEAVGAGAFEIFDGRVVAVFDGLAAGRYAASALHDENGDGRMNRAMMRPREGLAVSGQDQVSMPPPGFDDAAFPLQSDQSIVLTLTYW